MLWGLEIGMLVAGIIALATGRLKLTKTKVIEGGPARLLGLILLAPLPIQLVAGFAIGLTAATSGNPSPTGLEVSFVLSRLLIDAGCLVLMVVLGLLFAQHPNIDQRFPGLSESYGYPNRSTRPNHWESPTRPRDDEIPPAPREEPGRSYSDDRELEHERSVKAPASGDIQTEPRPWVSPPASDRPRSPAPLSADDPPLNRPPSSTGTSSLAWIGGIVLVIVVLGFAYSMMSSTANSLTPKPYTAPTFRPSTSKLFKGFQ